MRCRDFARKRPLQRDLSQVMRGRVFSPEKRLREAVSQIPLALRQDSIQTQKGPRWLDPGPHMQTATEPRSNLLQRRSFERSLGGSQPGSVASQGD